MAQFVLVDALFMCEYMRRLIDQRGALLASEAEGRGRTLTA